jgi:hypothetical protein
MNGDQDEGSLCIATGMALNKINGKGAEEMKVKSKGTMLLVIVGIVMAMAMQSTSQERQPDNVQTVNMQIVIEKIRADKKLLVAENMQLTEAEAKAFWPVYDRYQDELFLLRSRTAKLIKDYGDAYDKMTNDAARKLLDEFMTIESLGPKLRQAYLPKFRKALPEVKVVRYYQIENKIQAALFYELAANIPLAKAAQ